VETLNSRRQSQEGKEQNMALATARKCWNMLHDNFFIKFIALVSSSRVSSESFCLFFKAKHELDLDFFSFLNKLNPPSNVNDFSWSSLLCIIVFFTQGCEWIQSGMACLVKVCRFDFLRELEWKWVWAIGKVFENAL